MLKKLLYIFLSTLPILIIYHLSNGSVNKKQLASQDVQEVVKGNNQLAFKLYTHFAQRITDKNIFLSPWSITSALSMTYEGAKTVSKKEMENTLYLSDQEDLRKPAMKKLFNYLTDNNSFDLNIANALFLHQNYKLLDIYTQTIEKFYRGQVQRVNFLNEEESREIINDWVEDKTNDKIENLIPKKVINDLTRLILVNAIYFKSNWHYEFDEDKTKERNFQVSKTQFITAPLMYLPAKEEFKYFENKAFQAIELPYLDKKLSMVVILPKDEMNLSAKVDYKQYKGFINKLMPHKVKIYFPKFKFRNKYMMADALKEMGMRKSFTNQADFSGISGKKDLKISQVIHQSFIEVNEEGTEASAATAVVMSRKSISRNPLFKADHPFTFLIKDNATGLILFIGRVSNPLSNE